MPDLTRLLRPKSLAVVGGGVWCASVIQQAERMGFDGAIWPVHPTSAQIAGHGAFPTVADLPAPPDAIFIGVNRHATVDVVRDLAAMDAGGAVCFASGFAEAAAEDRGSGDLQAALVAAAGEMPILGPNCYGFINALDQVLLWPDQHGCVPVDRGVAIMTQSSNISINLTMQKRGLPIAYMVACGNMSQTSQAQIALALLDDPRVTAIGLHVEGFGDVAEWEALAARAYAQGVPLVALKVGASEQARSGTVTHTASLAGSDAGAQALLDRLGIPRVASPAALLETLKLLHVTGPLAGGRIASISCSGGEASLMADLAEGLDLVFPPLEGPQENALREALGPMVALSNPLDYHTYIWGDTARMTQAWSAMTGPAIDMSLSVVDYPHTDASAWRCTVEAALTVSAQTRRPFAVVASLPELMPDDIAQELLAGSVVPLCGLEDALSAVEAAAHVAKPHELQVAHAPKAPAGETLSEAAAKDILSDLDICVPKRCRMKLADACGYPDGASYAVKGEGLAHKSEAGAVRLNVAAEDVAAVAQEIGTDYVLIEEMVTDGVAELLIGITRDPAHGFTLTLGAGGVWTELLRDTVTLLLPVTKRDIDTALTRLRIYPLLSGYRGKSPANMQAIKDTIIALQTYVLEGPDSVSEVEINPLICTPKRAVAVDALIRKV